MERVEFPPMYRGDDYSLPVRFRRNIEDVSFTCQVRRDRWASPIDVVCDPTHQDDPLDLDEPAARPYLTLFIPGAVTALVEDSSLRGDLQDSPVHTVFKFRIPVEGEYTKPEEDD